MEEGTKKHPRYRTVVLEPEETNSKGKVNLELDLNTQIRQKIDFGNEISPKKDEESAPSPQLKAYQESKKEKLETAKKIQQEKKLLKEAEEAELALKKQMLEKEALEIPVYLKCLPNIKVDWLAKVYFLAVLGLLLPSCIEHYKKVEAYLDDGALDSVVYFFANAGIMLFIADRAFKYGILKVSKKGQLPFLFIVPLFLIQMEIDTYHEEMGNISAFDKWNAYYERGVKEYRLGKDLKQARYYLIRSIQDFSSDPSKKNLYLKSLVYLGIIEMSLGDLERGLDKLEKYWKVAHLETNYEAAMTTYGLGHIYNQKSQYEKANNYIFRCLEIIKELKLKDQELNMNCLFEQAIFHYQSHEIDDFYSITDKLFDYSPSSKNPKKFLLKLVRMTDWIFDAKQYDKSLEYYHRLLDLNRDSKNAALLAHLYGRVSELYNLKGEKLKGDIFLENQKFYLEKKGNKKSQEAQE